MPQLPPAATTMIGSVPHLNAGDAYALLDTFPLGIPAWAQLPKRSFKEGMIPQFSQNFPGICIDETEKKIWLQKEDSFLDQMTAFYEAVVENNLDYFALTGEYAAGMEVFLQQLAQAAHPLPVVKGHVTGPFTFGLGINDPEGKAIWYDEEYKDLIIKGLIMKGKWQIDKFKPFSDTVLIFYDEPILSGFGTSAYLGMTDDEVIDTLGEVIAEMKQLGALVGSHCCGNTDWGLFVRSGLDIIAFDAYSFGEKVALYAADLKTFFQRDGILAWGVIPTLDSRQLNNETYAGIKKKFDALVDVFTGKGINRDTLFSHMILTPACGMGATLNTTETAKVLTFLQQLSQDLGQ